MGLDRFVMMMMMMIDDAIGRMLSGLFFPFVKAYSSFCDLFLLGFIKFPQLSTTARRHRSTIPLLHEGNPHPIKLIFKLEVQSNPISFRV